MTAPITCHVLNTVSGTPADNLKATLTHYKISSHTGAQTLEAVQSFNATTDADGRIKSWSTDSNKALNDLLGQYSDGEKLAFSIKFEIGPWYEERSIESFWPEVEIKFYIKKGERHYHVPCLVGPWTYTTYRGS